MKKDDETSRPWPALVAVTLSVLGAGAFWILSGPGGPKLLGQSQEAEATTAVISWKTSPDCFSLVEYRPADSVLKTRTPPEPAPVAEHRHVLTALSPGTSYKFQILHSTSAGGEYTPLSPVEFIVTTASPKPSSTATTAGPARAASDSTLADASRQALDSYSTMSTQERSEAAKAVEVLIQPSPRPGEQALRSDPAHEAEFKSRLEVLRRKVEDYKRKGVDVDRWLKDVDIDKKVREIEASGSVGQLDDIMRALDGIDEDQIKSFIEPESAPPPLLPLGSSRP